MLGLCFCVASWWVLAVHFKESEVYEVGAVVVRWSLLREVLVSFL